MTTRNDTVPLSDVVGTALDAASGVVATRLLPLLNHNAALIGTSKGSLLVCVASADNTLHTLQPMSDVVLHCGPVYDIALSTQHLIATAGHDAVACVFPLHALFSEAGVAQCRRLTGHTVPIVALRFLSDGTTLVTLAADGTVRIVDAVRGDVLGVLSTGFAATSLACSLDETQLFVGGRCLAALDLYSAMRPASMQAAAAASAWTTVGGGTAQQQQQQGEREASAAPRVTSGVRLYQWAAPSTSAFAAVTHVSETQRGVVISRLSVDGEDGALTAFFASCGAVEGISGCARWSAEGGRTADNTEWEVQTFVDQKERKPRGDAAAPALSVRSRAKAAARPSTKHSPPSSSTNTSSSSSLLSSQAAANTAAALWHGRWYASPFELSGEMHRLPLAEKGLTPAAVATAQDVTAPLPYPYCGPRTRDEEMAAAEAECDALQRECDALVFQIRTRRATHA